MVFLSPQKKQAITVLPSTFHQSFHPGLKYWHSTQMPKAMLWDLALHFVLSKLWNFGCGSYSIRFEAGSLRPLVPNGSKVYKKHQRLFQKSSISNQGLAEQREYWARMSCMYILADTSSQDIQAFAPQSTKSRGDWLRTSERPGQCAQVLGNICYCLITKSCLTLLQHHGL